MTDLNYLIEGLLLIALPFMPIVIGVLMRRKFALPRAAEGGRIPPVSGAHKAGRLVGNLLILIGIAALLFMLIVMLNFKGKL